MICVPPAPKLSGIATNRAHRRTEARVRWMATLAFILSSALAQATPDLRFDVAWFCCPCYPDAHFCQTQLDHLNWPSPNGHYIAMSSDAHRADLAANGNLLAGYYNTLNDGWTTNSAAQQAAIINQYIVNGFTSTGARPDWLILNELSAGTWPGNATYRTWVRDVVHTLKYTYGYNVIVYAPFSNPGANDADWQGLAADGYVAVENYLSGAAIKAQNFSVSWCQSQYQSSITSYGNRGVPRSRLMLGEHFGQTTNTLADGTPVTWGRNSVSFADWDQAIAVRGVAARNVGFPGFLSYAWYSDTMLAPDADLLHFEDTYSSNSLPTSNPLTPPFIVTQPQSQTVAPGGLATFSVATAGVAPLTYQWQLNNTNLPGATTNLLTITNVAPAHGGVYQVVISNAAGSTNSARASLTVKLPDPLAFEAFAAGLTSYSVGANLAGQTNATGNGWSPAGPTGANVTLAGGNLTVPGLAASSGNRIQYGVATGPSARFNLSKTISGTLYYSFAFQVSDLGSLDGSGGFFAAFNNSTGNQASVPTVVGAAVQTRSAAGGFNIGLKKASAGSVFDSAVHAIGETIFVVSSYTFNPAATDDDVANLWINPDRATFGTGTAPTPTLSSSSGGDITANQIYSFIFFRRGDGSANLQPAAMLSDELRIGTSWASVTPPLVNSVMPALNVTLSTNSLILSWTTNAPGFILETTSSLSTSNTWTPVPEAIGIVGGQYAATNTVVGAGKFYRLRKP
jgi:hypothetical protein